MTEQSGRWRSAWLCDSSVRASGRSWDEFERVGVVGSHNGEVSVVEGGDAGLIESFGDSDEAGVNKVESEIVVGVGELDAAVPVIGGEFDRFELTSGNEAKESLMGSGAETVENQPSRLRDDWGGRSPGLSGEQVGNLAVAC